MWGIHVSYSYSYLWLIFFLNLMEQLSLYIVLGFKKVCAIGSGTKLISLYRLLHKLLSLLEQSTSIDQNSSLVIYAALCNSRCKYLNVISRIG